MKFTKKDKEIIAYLRRDSRMQLTKLSRKTGIPVSTLFERIKSLRTSVITKPTLILKFSELGMGTHVFIMIKTFGNNRNKVIDYLRNNKNTNSLWRINNHFDILAEVVFADLKEFDDFLQKLDENFSIRDIELEYVVEEFKKEDFFSDPNTVKLLTLQCKTKVYAESI